MSKQLTVEIHGTGTHNRGAELMAIAVAERLRCDFSKVRIVVPAGFGCFEERGRYGFWNTWEFTRGYKSRMARAFFRLGGLGLRHKMGVLDPDQIDMVLDASGFAFSDQWGHRPAQKLALKMMGSARREKPLVLLPQALGPFDDPDVALWGRKVVERALLVCARDTESLRMVKTLGVNSEHIRQYPDFTIGIEPTNRHRVELPANFVAIVPNVRMIDKGSGNGDYLEFLTRVVGMLKQRGVIPVVVLHDAEEDRRIVELLLNHGCDLPVIQHSDPRVLKAILGAATFVVASRFHALVSSLSQAVPCLGAGWSHKYQELFSEFDCSELLITNIEDAGALEGALDLLMEPPSYQDLRARIGIAGGKAKGRVEEMWREVGQLIAAYA